MATPPVQFRLKAEDRDRLRRVRDFHRLDTESAAIRKLIRDAADALGESKPSTEPGRRR